MFLEICERLDFCEECKNALYPVWKTLKADYLDQLQQACRCVMTGDEQQGMTLLPQLIMATGFPPEMIFAVTLLESVPYMKACYEKKSLPESVLWDTLVDVRCKLEEHYSVNGRWGTMEFGWYARLLNACIIKLGRLEFEPIDYRWETPCMGTQKGDPVLNVHIPSAGPLRIEDVMDSFKRAYQFFGYEEPMRVVVASWMLYPPMCDAVLKNGSNLKKFYELFQLVEQQEDPENKDFWRIFHMAYGEGVLDKVLTDTSLRRGLYEYMKSGRNMGIGRGILLFDGEKVISK